MKVRLALLGVFMLSVSCSLGTGYTDESLRAWTIQSGLDLPESSYADELGQAVYVSNMSADATEKNGRGYILKASLTDGSILNRRWVSGIHSPKGLRRHGNRLWVACVDEVLAIGIGGSDDGKILARVALPGAQNLNDVEVDPKGVVYVSDTFTNRVYRVEDGKASVLLESSRLASPNGLLVQGNRLYVVSSDIHVNGVPSFENARKKGHVLAVDLDTKAISQITRSGIGSLDGIEPDGDGGFFVSDWELNSVYRVSATGDVKNFLRVPGGIADFSVAPKARLIVVPLPRINAVKAFRY
jgi:sugar lactone lactonase YvrE